MRSPPPVSVGEELEATAGPWDDSGAACSDVGGWQLRAAGALPGERVRVRVDAASRGAPVLFGHRVATLADGPVERRRSPCSVHVRCGGCPIITAGRGQFEAKVRSGLASLPTALTATLDDESRWLRSPLGLGYRQKAVLLPDWGRRLKLGGFARRTHDVVDHADCAVLAPALLRARSTLHRQLEAALRAGSGATQPPGPAGPPHALRSLILRGNRQGQVMATAVGWSDAARPWVEEAFAGAVGDGIDGLHFQAFGASGDRVQGAHPAERVAGAGTLREQIGEVELTLRPLAFFQVNPDVLELIVATLAGRLPESGTLADLYCGGGALGLAIAAGRPGLRIVGVERDKRALASAGKDARRLGVEATWLEGTPEACRGELPESADAVILDPPRGGLSPAALAACTGMAARHIAYVACRGPSLARDMEQLSRAGYRPTLLVPADMLPQTPHVEWLAFFERR